MKDVSVQIYRKRVKFQVMVRYKGSGKSAKVRTRAFTGATRAEAIAHAEAEMKGVVDWVSLRLGTQQQPDSQPEVRTMSVRAPSTCARARADCTRSYSKGARIHTYTDTNHHRRHAPAANAPAGGVPAPRANSAARQDRAALPSRACDQCVERQPAPAQQESARHSVPFRTFARRRTQRVRKHQQAETGKEAEAREPCVT